MAEPLKIPEAFKEVFWRLTPHMPARLRKRQDVIDTLIIYLKFGGERLARLAMEAAIAEFRIEQTAERKRRREEALAQRPRLEDESDDQDDDKEEDDIDEDEDGDDDNDLDDDKDDDLD